MEVKYPIRGLLGRLFSPITLWANWDHIQIYGSILVSPGRYSQLASVYVWYQACPLGHVDSHELYTLVCIPAVSTDEESVTKYRMNYSTLYSSVQCTVKNKLDIIVNKKINDEII